MANFTVTRQANGRYLVRQRRGATTLRSWTCSNMTAATELIRLATTTWRLQDA